jgi:peptidoglycan biosynthesis protein MviN/MurJ (putative lipid II flippase)
MALLIVYFVAAPEQWFAWGMFQRVAQLSMWIMIGAISYFSMLWITGIRWHNMTAKS